jgi:hypothetical protein
MYCNSYVEIKRDKAFEDAELEDFILATNRDLDFQSFSFEKMTVSKDEVLTIGNGGLYEFTKSKRGEVISVLKEKVCIAKENLFKAKENMCKAKDKESELKSLIDLNDFELEEAIKGFLDKLVFAVNLPNESDLGDIIKSELRGDKFKLIDVDFIFNDFQEFISN